MRRSLIKPFQPIGMLSLVLFNASIPFVLRQDKEPITTVLSAETNENVEQVPSRWFDFP
jgi:hypothetical protein